MLPAEDVPLLNEMCPHIATPDGQSPPLCCDRKQIAEMQKFKYILDNLIGRCPSCYFNFLRIFCEMACNADQDEFIWPLEHAKIGRPREVPTKHEEDGTGVRKDWALDDYVDPEEEKDENDDDDDEPTELVPAETVEVITKIRYFISDDQANAFINSCWSVRINFQYAVDVLCGSLNRQCDVKKLFQYIGMKNTQSPIKIDFVFVNGSYYDRELRRTFRPSTAQMFACDQPVLLPHVSRQKCTCMDCQTMCPKVDQKKRIQLQTNQTDWIERLQTLIIDLPLTTKLVVIIYFLFVLLFIFVNLILGLCHFKRSKSATTKTTNNTEQLDLDVNELEKLNQFNPTSNEENQSDVSSEAKHEGLLERLGMKMDDSLHRIFTA